MAQYLKLIIETVQATMYCYFFSGNQYIRVLRGETGAGKTDSGYPAKISNWLWPPGFGENGIDAALYSGSVCFFFKGPQYIQVTRGITGPALDGPNGKPEIAGPFPISNWKWPGTFGASGIDAALWSGTVSYFFSGNEYIRVTRKSDTDFGTTDPGYPRSIYAGWGWDNVFNNGIKGALPSGSRCYFFRGTQYIRVRRGFELGGFIDEPIGSIPNWDWPSGFGENGIDAALYSGGPLQDPGTNGLGSFYNYILADGGKNITGLSVTINIDNDIVSPTTAEGFSFQLNCFGPQVPDGSGTPTFQQFVFDNAPNDINMYGLINNWEFESSTNQWTELLDVETSSSFVLPAANTIRQGSVLQITPSYNSNEQITGCTFSYTDPTGNTTSKSISITTIPLAPITSITLNIVAYGNGDTTTFTTGQGTITYSATNPLTAQSSSAGTGEKGNIVYERLPPTVNVSQLFGVAPPGWVAPDFGKVPLDKRPPPRTHSSSRLLSATRTSKK